ncbi:hypothetical protein MANES_09G113525v8 [Manihot esculenta]|uniref:Uncharacterized protein n=1 Tax=Manihot esculenta TaxID=3983 RepID=A0A2C9VBD1_MANES|nr:hypothetical protein MANES_09G113525v8 [Manihot esculenta]
MAKSRSLLLEQQHKQQLASHLESAAADDSVCEMAKEIKDLRCWIEVAPALFISLHRTRNSPGLETIPEEQIEDGDDDSEF